VNNISKIGFLFFIILVVGIIIYSITTADKFGDSYLEQLRIADADKTLDNVSDDISIEIGKLVCSDTVNWINQESSILSIQNILIKNGIKVEKENRIIPIIRFHSVYELCPENINVLEEIFGKNE
tara:strand:+ start:25 stop:399 length:375 start_codon:yes stop_codon:yes gene_type:complete